MKTRFSFFLLSFFTACLFAQTKPDVALVREGNGMIGNKKYNEAEICYRKALVENPKNTAAAYNLALSLQLQKKTEEALKQYETSITLMSDNNQKANAYHNIGNAYCASQEWEKAIEKYKSSLRLNPTDMDTKYNLAFAQRKLQQQQQQQQQKKEEKEDKKEDKKEEDKNENQKPGDEKKDNKEPTQKPGDISKDQAKKMLNAIQAQEAKVNDKMQNGDKKAGLINNGKDW